MTSPHTSPEGAKPAPIRYERLTSRMALQLAAPHTWPAAILPALIGIATGAAVSNAVSFTTALVLLAICILMQSAVNTFNDYYDFVKGADSKEDDVDPTDATLVYNNVNPRCALALAIGFLVAAFLLGSYIIYLAGWIPLVIALIGAVFVVAYSAGKTPVSYLPIGEAVSGIVMGGLIPLACHYVVAGAFTWIALLMAVPTIIGVGLIMFTNNTCDIEKDELVQRKTLSVLLGRTRAVKLYHALVIVWIMAICVLTAVFFRTGIFVLPCMLLAAYPLVKALFSNPLNSTSRIGAMAQICSLNIALGAFYAASILSHAVFTITL